MKLSSTGAFMGAKPNLVWVSSALMWLAAAMPAAGQTVYKCPSRTGVLYSEKPCAGRIISTEQAPVAAKPNPKDVDLHRLEQARIEARALRRMPDESAEQFALRKRRTAMLSQDRAECARLDTRMPVEQESMKNPDPAEVHNAEVSLHHSQKRFRELRC
jgi:predicted secreted protein